LLLDPFLTVHKTNKSGWLPCSLSTVLVVFASLGRLPAHRSTRTRVNHINCARVLVCVLKLWVMSNLDITWNCGPLPSPTCWLSKYGQNTLDGNPVSAETYLKCIFDLDLNGDAHGNWQSRKKKQLREQQLKFGLNCFQLVFFRCMQ